jgi:hypothetical protein
MDFDHFGDGDGHKSFAPPIDLGAKQEKKFTLALLGRPDNGLVKRPGKAIDPAEERFEEFRGQAGKCHLGIPRE